MTIKSAQRRQAAKDAAPAAAASATPGPWDAPWHTKEDSTGWQTIYRGTGQRRGVQTSVLVDLTAEQRTWARRAAKAAGLTLTGFISKVIEDARVAADVATRKPPEITDSRGET